MHNENRTQHMGGTKGGVILGGGGVPFSETGRGKI